MSKNTVKQSEQPATKPVCGIVMPISAIDGLDEGHWADVLKILQDAVSSAGFEPNLVSDSEDIGVIQKRIVQNLYENEMIVCDVSGKNANVMFELGLRLAFDKPTIVIKDDKTGYSFDTSPIEHIEYPRDLRFGSIVAFKEKLEGKIKATLKASREDKNYTTFLKHFGTFKVAHIETQEVSEVEYILSELKEIRKELRISRNVPYHPRIRLDEEKFYSFSNHLNDALNSYCEKNKVSRRILPKFKQELRMRFTEELNAPQVFSSPNEYETYFDEAFDSYVSRYSLTSKTS